MALWPLTCSSGFGPWFQSAELPLGNGSLSTINSCLSSSHTPWARSLLPEGALLLSCVPLLPAQVTAAPNALLGTYQIFKSLFFCRKKMLITRGSHLNSAGDRNHLLFVTLLPVSDGLLGKGSVYACTKDMASLVFFGWMLFCSHLNNHLFFLSKRAYMGKSGPMRGEGKQYRKHKVIRAPVLQRCAWG